MITEVPAYDSDQPPDDSKPKDMTHESKGVFHWPPDCLWPFKEQRSESDTSQSCRRMSYLLAAHLICIGNNFGAREGRTDMLKAVKESVHRMTNHLQLISGYLEMEVYPRR